MSAFSSPAIPDRVIYGGFASPAIPDRVIYGVFACRAIPDRGIYGGFVCPAIPDRVIYVVFACRAIPDRAFASEMSKGIHMQVALEMSRCPSRLFWFCAGDFRGCQKWSILPLNPYGKKAFLFNLWGGVLPGSLVHPSRAFCDIPIDCAPLSRILRYSYRLCAPLACFAIFL